MGESSKFPKSWTLENQNLKLAVCLQNIKNSKINGKLPLNKLKLNQNSAFWDWLSMESQPQNPIFRNYPENFHPCLCSVCWMAGLCPHTPVSLSLGDFQWITCHCWFDCFQHIEYKTYNLPGKPETRQNQKICPTLLKELLYCCDLGIVGKAFCWWAHSGHLMYAYYRCTCMVR